MPSMGGGAADGLQQVLQRLFLEATTTQQQRAQQQQLERQAQIDAESTRRWDAEHALRQNTWNRTVEQDRLKVEQDATQKAAAKAALDPILNDPTIPAPARNLLRLGQHGMGANLNVHALEAPDAHAAHVAVDAKTDDDRRFASWKQQQDYSESLRAKRPVGGRLVKVDPTFPVGVQSHLAQIRSRHGDFEGALGEFVNSLDQHRQAHPHFLPQKAITALQQMYTGGGRPAAGSDGIDGLVATALGGTANPPTSGRGAGPGARSTAGPDGATKAVSLAELQAVATARGTTVEQERARAAAAGYAVR